MAERVAIRMNSKSPINKIVASCDDAIRDVRDGSVLLVGGWGGIGIPTNLLIALSRREVRDLVLVSNNCGMGIENDVAILFRAHQVRKAIATFPARPNAREFLDAYERGEVELELVPQGTLVERLRAAGAGLGGFYTPVGADTPLADGREVRMIDGRPHLFETPLHGDVAFIKARRADRYGNLRFDRAARNFNPIMAIAATLTIAEVDELEPNGALDPDDIHAAGIFVDRVVVAGNGR